MNVDRAVPVGVRHHDDEVLGAAERLDALARVRRTLVHGPATGVEPTKETARMLVVAERLDDRPAAMDEVDDAGRQVELVDELEDPFLGERHLLGGLDEG